MSDVLVVHAQHPLRQSLVEYLRRNDHTVCSAVDLDEARAADCVASTDYAAVVIGVAHGERSATAIRQIKRAWPAAEVVVIGQSSDLREATEAVRQGAYDYVVASDLTSLGRSLREALQRRHNEGAASSSAAGGSHDELVLQDPGTLAVFARADRVAMFKTTVLIMGESGTGKEVLARRLYHQDGRRYGKFVPVNCGSLPDTLVETELFGYKRGAFTGAGSSSKGLIEEAEGGVLFLDEIGDMPLSIQGRLLRFLDSGEIRPVGDTRLKHVDVRVIAATNRCLRTEVLEKRFREDLFFRLSVVTLQLPALRDRRADLPMLIEYHGRHGAMRLGVPVRNIADEAMALLVAYPWPGNIRELRNVLEEALLQDSPGMITPRDLPAHIVSREAAATALIAAETGGNGRELISVLQRHKGNRKEAASELGISRTTLWRRLIQLNAATGSQAVSGIRARHCQQGVVNGIDQASSE